MPDVYVGIGSNIDPERHLQQGVAALSAAFGPLRCSAVFASPPLGFEGPDFLNMVVVFTTAADADSVEAQLHDIEYDGGRRRRGPRFASRALDLDLLLYGAMVDARRRVPRDDVLRYPFVLAPLAEIAPGLRHPLTGRRLAAEWEDLAVRGTVELARRGSVAALR